MKRLLIAAAATVVLVVCGGPLGSPQPPVTTCAAKLNRCLLAAGRPAADCAREFVACIGPWPGPSLGGP